MTKKGIDLFAGAGGMSLGAMNAGIKIIAAIDNNPHATSTFLRNHPKTLVIQGDIREVEFKNLIDPTDEIFVIFGGPPCQGFSTSNTKTRNQDNPNNHLFEEFVRSIQQVNPKWFVFENVAGITSFNNGETVRQIKNLFKDLGYDTNEEILYASDYGVPQHRNRFFMVGNRLGVDFVFPPPLRTTVTVADAISDLPDLENGDTYGTLPYKGIDNISEYAMRMRKGSEYSTQNFVSRNREYVIERYSYIRQGENWKAIPASLMDNYTNKTNCHSGIYKRLDSSKPSVVISNYRKNMLIHPLSDRGLSVREAARLQSFPDTFVFEGTITHIQQQIGNAVPPLLAEAIFKQILTYGDTSEYA